jgi:DNA repair photolyase
METGGRGKALWPASPVSFRDGLDGFAPERYLFVHVLFARTKGMNATRASAVNPRHEPAAIAERILPGERRRGRGAATNVSGRFEIQSREDFDDGWTREEAPEPLATEVTIERPKSVITRNESPDISFDRSINPYRGCEHGCFYCFARPTHAYMGLSAGLDFETRLFAKEGAAALLEHELAAAKYVPAPIAFGTNTDPYQPIERQYRITRSLLETLHRVRHPLSIVTKSNLILRDLDILSDMGRDGLVKVFLSVTTLDRELARKMEPRAPTPQKRLEAIEALNDAGVPAGVMVAPIIPAINDSEIERILARAYAAGAREGGYVVLRLPLEIRDMFREWLQVHYPDKLSRAVSLIQSMHGGKDYESQWGRRMAGSGPYAWMIGRRFEMAARRLGYRETKTTLRTDLFRKPTPAANKAEAQLSLF